MRGFKCLSQKLLCIVLCARLLQLSVALIEVRSIMSLTLYYLAASPPTRSVDLVINALGLTAEHKEVILTNKEHLTPEYLKVNPLHTIPAIDDNGFVLWESHAIMTYLVSKYGKDDSLYPKDLQKRAIVDQRLHYSNDVFYIAREAVMRVLFLSKNITEELIEKMKEHQDNVEKLLAGNKFIAGNTLTVADYSFIMIMDILELLAPSDGKYLLTADWFSRCRSTMKDFDKVNPLRITDVQWTRRFYN